MVPTLISAFLYIAKNGTNEGFLFTQLTIILTSNLISLASITFVIFVPWKKGPVWYTKVSHVIFHMLLLTNYLIIPLINLGLAFFFIVDPNYNLRDQTV